MANISRFFWAAATAAIVLSSGKKSLENALTVDPKIQLVSKIDHNGCETTSVEVLFWRKLWEFIWSNGREAPSTSYGRDMNVSLGSFWVTFMGIGKPPRGWGETEPALLGGATSTAAGRSAAEERTIKADRIAITGRKLDRVLFPKHSRIRNATHFTEFIRLG